MVTAMVTSLFNKFARGLVSIAKIGIGLVA